MSWYNPLTWPRPQPVHAQSPLAGKPLRYLIGAEDPGDGAYDVITEVPYGRAPVKRGVSIGYCNLFDELNTGQLGPYLHNSDTARQYSEGQIDPRGAGWGLNLNRQFINRKNQRFEYIELDNPDAYDIKDVIGAIDLAAKYGLKVIAKNPGLMIGDGELAYVSHPNVHGIIVEKGAGGPNSMDTLRRAAQRPDIPIWFVFFGGGRSSANTFASIARGFRNMGVTFSSKGEYGSSEDILRPQP